MASDCSEIIKRWTQSQFYTVQLIDRTGDSRSIISCPLLGDMSDRELTCRFSPDMADELADVKKFEVRLVIGSWEKVVYEEVEIQGSPNVLVIGTAAAVIVVLVAFVLVMWCVRRRNRKKARNLENQERLLRDKEEKDAIKVSYFDFISLLFSSYYNTMTSFETKL